jgi:hypothetical protein
MTGTVSLSILDVFFPKTFNENFLVNAAINGRKEVQLPNARSKAPPFKRILKKTGFLGSEDGADVQLIETDDNKPETTTTVSVGQSDVQEYGKLLPAPKDLTYRDKNTEPHSMYVWSTAFLQPDSARDERAFFDLLASGASDWSRRFLGAYYELCVYYGLLSYFERRPQSIALCTTLIHNDMQYGNNFGAVVNELAGKTLATWTKQMLARDRDKITGLFKLEYQPPYDDGTGTTFSDFKLKPKSPDTIQTTRITLRGIGNVKFTYKYDRDITIEMKSLAVDSDEDMVSKSFRNVEQARKEENNHISCLLGLFKYKASGIREAPYGKITLLFRQDNDSKTEMMEYVGEIENLGTANTHICHFASKEHGFKPDEFSNLWADKNGNYYMYFNELEVLMPLNYPTAKQWTEKRPHLCFYPRIDLKVKDGTDERKPVVSSTDTRSYGLLYMRAKPTRNQIVGHSLNLYVGLEQDKDGNLKCTLHKQSANTLNEIDAHLWPGIIKYFELYCEQENITSFYEMAPEDYIVFVDAKSDTKTLVVADTGNEFSSIIQLYPSIVKTTKSATKKEAKQFYKQKKQLLVSISTESGTPETVYVHSETDTKINTFLESAEKFNINCVNQTNSDVSINRYKFTDSGSFRRIEDLDLSKILQENIELTASKGKLFMSIGSSSPIGVELYHDRQHVPFENVKRAVLA